MERRPGEAEGRTEIVHTELSDLPPRKPSLMPLPISDELAKVERDRLYAHRPVSQRRLFDGMFQQAIMLEVREDDPPTLLNEPRKRC